MRICLARSEAYLHTQHTFTRITDYSSVREETALEQQGGKSANYKENLFVKRNQIVMINSY